jgi:hypothetical protein
VPGNHDRSLGATSHRSVDRAKEPDGAHAAGTWPIIAWEVRYSERMILLCLDGCWWPVSSAAQMRMVMLIRVQKNPGSMHIELWEMGPNPYRMTRHSPINVPLRTNTIDIDANSTVVPPMATFNIPYASGRWRGSVASCGKGSGPSPKARCACYTDFSARVLRSPSSSAPHCQPATNKHQGVASSVSRALVLSVEWFAV